MTPQLPDEADIDRQLLKLETRYRKVTRQLEFVQAELQSLKGDANNRAARQSLLAKLTELTEKRDSLRDEIERLEDLT